MNDNQVFDAYNEHLNASNEIQKAIVEPNFDTSLDYAELGLDSFVTDHVLKDIPIVKTFVGGLKTVQKFKEIFFIKKLLTFLKTFHSGNLPELKMIEFKIRFKDDQNYRNSVLEKITIFNDRFLEVEKSKLFANIFLAHLNGKLSWYQLITISICIEKLDLSTLDFLNLMAHNEFRLAYETFNDDVALLLTTGFLQQNGSFLVVTRIGIYFFFYGVQGTICCDIDFERYITYLSESTARPIGSNYV